MSDELHNMVLDKLDGVRDGSLVDMCLAVSRSDFILPGDSVYKCVPVIIPPPPPLI